MMDLERNLIDNILECELKLGYAGTPVTFYYPVTSIMELLGCNPEELDLAIDAFQKKEQHRLGEVTIEELATEKGRYAVTVLVEGIQWVHEKFKPTEFMRLFVSEIRRPGNTLEDILQVFKRFSPEIEVKKAADREWAVSFADADIDPYVYHIEQNTFGLEYHRFTRAAYRMTMPDISIN